MQNGFCIIHSAIDATLTIDGDRAITTFSTDVKKDWSIQSEDPTNPSAQFVITYTPGLLGAEGAKPLVLTLGEDVTHIGYTILVTEAQDPPSPSQLWTLENQEIKQADEMPVVSASIKSVEKPDVALISALLGMVTVPVPIAVTGVPSVPGSDAPKWTFKFFRP